MQTVSVCMKCQALLFEKNTIKLLSFDICPECGKG